MALNSWKNYRFFDVSPVKIQDADGLALFTSGEVTSTCPSPEYLFLGTSNGTVNYVNRSFKIVRSFRACDEGTIVRMKHVEDTTFLLTVIEDLPNEPKLKLWDLDKTEKTGLPRCLSTVTIQNNGNHYPISAFAALDDLSQLAVGFANGAVCVVRGDLVHDRGTRQRIVFESKEPITGVDFREGKMTALYIATTARILTLVISGRGQGQPARNLDDHGCDLDCMAIDRDTGDIMVGRNDGIYHYGIHGRGTVINCDGKKTLIRKHKSYAVYACPSSTTSLSRSTLSGPGASERSSTLVVLHTDLHYIAHTEALQGIFQMCFTIWNDLFVVLLDGSVIRYHEKPLQQRLEVLFQSENYMLAIQIARHSGVDERQQNMIFRRYGDYLYQKRDYDTAMQQYLRAIDASEPSTIIRKFLGTQRVHNLIEYLEELHEHHKANSDHTILLLNCYAKLKDVEKLENFIRIPGDTRFDADTAISMCRQGGYFDQAAYLARKQQEHDMVVTILVEDLKKYAEALAYICRLEPAPAYQNLLHYATVLIEHCPQEATQLFIDYYTAKYKPKKDAVVVTKVSENAPKSQPGFASSAVQSLASILPLPYMSMGTKDAGDEEVGKTDTQIVESISDEAPAVYDIPRPRTAFSAFVDHPERFVQFLEACVQSEEIKGEDRTDLYTTLFEMYLRKAHESNDASQKTEWEDKARKLIEGKQVPIDASNVLLLSDLEKFNEGTILVREKQGLRFDIFRSYTAAKDTQGAIKALRKYGPADPQLYPAALAYFTSDEKVLEEAGTEIDAVLTKIERDQLMAPIQVIQTLSKNSVATMGLLKKYLQDTISREREEITSNRRMISTFRDDTTKKKDEYKILTTQSKTFRNTRCSSCHYALDQPIVHFFCEHSFHQRCLNVQDGETVETVECPLCAPQNATVRAIKRSQDVSKDKHDVFKGALDRSRDRFGTVAEWVGRGVMNAAPPES